MATTNVSISQNSAEFTSPKIACSEAQRTLQDGWRISDRLEWAMGLKVAPLTKLVAVAIANRASSSSGLCWPGMGTLAKDTGMSRSSVIRGVAELEWGGHLSVTRLKLGKKNVSNRYRLPPMQGSTETPPSSTQTPGGSVCVEPEPVRTLEPVKKAALLPVPKTGQQEPRGKQLSPGGTIGPFTKSASIKAPKPARHTCPKCGNDWPIRCGTKCYTKGCGWKQGAFHPAGQAAPVKGKYDDLWDDTPRPARADPPEMKVSTRLQLESDARANGYTMVAGRWMRLS